jgi:RNA polymerase sigma factor (sigma-70 family)
MLAAARAKSATNDGDYVDELQSQIARVIESIQLKMSFFAEERLALQMSQATTTTTGTTATQAKRVGLTRQNEILLAKAVEAGEKARKTYEEGGWMAPREKSRLQAAIRNAEEAKKIFVLANVGLVRSEVKKHARNRPPSVSIEDMEQAGYVGLLKALQKYDWRLGYRFSTYSFYHIQKEVGVARAASAMIRVPATRSQEIKRVKELYTEMTASSDREPTFKEMADKIGLKAERIEEDLQLVNRFVGVFPKEDMERFSEKQSISSWTRALLPWDALVEKITVEELNAHIAVLEPSERTALQMRFGLGGEKEHTYKEIEEALNLSRAKGWSFTQKALKKIKTNSWAQGQSW